MSQHAATSTPVPETPVDVPDTDDPVVLRELLRQAREHLRMRESIEQLMAENVARTEALLIEARASRSTPLDTNRTELERAIETVRTSLQDAMTAVDRLGALLSPVADPPADDEPDNAPTSPAAIASDQDPRRVEVLIHNVHSPALARSVQQFLLNIEGIAGAEVRELAEGLLRITVTTSAPITGDSLAGWEPERPRTVRTSSANVLELELHPDTH